MHGGRGRVLQASVRVFLPVNVPVCQSIRGGALCCLCSSADAEVLLSSVSSPDVVEHRGSLQVGCRINIPCHVSKRRVLLNIPIHWLASQGFEGRASRFSHAERFDQGPVSY